MCSLYATLKKEDFDPDLDEMFGIGMGCCISAQVIMNHVRVFDPFAPSLGFSSLPEAVKCHLAQQYRKEREEDVA